MQRANLVVPHHHDPLSALLQNSENMALKPGKYLISSVMTNEYIGRTENEDASTRPKEIVLLPKGVLAPKVGLNS